MIKKLFSSDKNYLLHQIQEETKSFLLTYLVEYVKEFYLQFHNPLGLVDNTIEKIKQTSNYPLIHLDPFYYNLAGIYRYKYGEVQLSFIFDNFSHEEKYETEWVDYFKRSVEEYCFNEQFVKAVLEITVFHPKDRVALLAGNRMKYFLENHFELRVYKYKGIKKLKAS